MHMQHSFSFNVIYSHILYSINFSTYYVSRDQRRINILFLILFISIDINIFKMKCQINCKRVYFSSVGMI